MLGPSELDPADFSGGFLAAMPAVALCPILDPLELLRLAGVPDRGVLTLPALRGLLVGELCADRVVCTGPDPASPLEVVRGDDFGRNGTFLTVFVETALLSEERDDRRLVRELLLSTSNCCCCLAAFTPSSGDSVLRIEFVRRGNRFLLTRDGGFPLRDLLRSKAD